jgi:hypothetical protein
MSVTAVVAWITPDETVELRPSMRMGKEGLSPGENALFPDGESRLELHSIDATNGKVTVAVGVPPIVLAQHGTVEHDGFRLHLRELEVDVRMREAVVRTEVQVEKDGQTWVLHPGFIDRGQMGREFLEEPIGDTGISLVVGGAHPAHQEAELFLTPTPEETLWIEASTKPFIGWLWVGTVLVTFGMMLAGTYRGRLARRFETTSAGDRGKARKGRSKSAPVAAS